MTMDPAVAAATVWFMRSSAVLARDVAGELVLATSQREDLDILSPTAARVWHLLDLPRSFQDLLERLSADYGVRPEEIVTDVERLLEGLLERGLIEAVADADD